MNQYPNQEQEAQQQYQHYYQQPLHQSSKLLPQKPKRIYLLTVASGVLALLGFLLPYFATYSGYELASLYGLYWLAPLSLIAVVGVLGMILLTGKGRWAWGLIGIGVVAAFLHYQLVGRDSVPMYWGIGAWLYFLGMIGVALSGIPILLTLSSGTLRNPGREGQK